MKKFIELLKNKLMEINKNIIRCKRCFMDTTAEDILFTTEGCNFCNEFIKLLKKPYKKIDINLEKLIEKIKNEGRNKKYNCIVGISGGIDSSYTLIKVKKFGLTPLALHLDNGWDTDLAKKNIENLVNKLKVDLYQYKLNETEQISLLKAFLNADVVDVEVLSDNAIIAINYKIAEKLGVNYILSGTNTSNEGMRIPKNWSWFKYDKKNIYSIAKKYNIKIKNFLIIGTLDYLYYEYIKNIKWISFLDYLPKYNKLEVLKELTLEYNYKSYPYKHYESILTRFYQGYILPIKFGIDKRKLHLSMLVLSNQMGRKEAEEMLSQLTYPDEDTLIYDLDFFLTKLNWTKETLWEYLHRPPKKHADYGSEKWLWDTLKIVKKYFLNLL